MNKPRGFARLSLEERTKMAALGGSSVPAEKRSFSKNRKLAAQAGKKGGTSLAPERRMFAADRALAVRAGRMGGKAHGKIT